MTFQWPETGRIERRYGTRYLHHITTRNWRYGEGYDQLGAGETPATSGGVVHKLAHRFRVRGEESTPSVVVAPSASGLTLTVEEGQPVLHVCFGNPHSILPTPYIEGHDVGQDSILGAPSR